MKLLQIVFAPFKEGMYWALLEDTYHDGWWLYMKGHGWFQHSNGSNLNGQIITNIGLGGSKIDGIRKADNENTGT